MNFQAASCSASGRALTIREGAAADYNASLGALRRRQGPYAQLCALGAASLDGVEDSAEGGRGSYGHGGAAGGDGEETVGASGIAADVKGEAAGDHVCPPLEDGFALRAVEGGLRGSVIAAVAAVDEEAARGSHTSHTPVSSRTWLFASEKVAQSSCSASALPSTTTT